MANQDWTQQRVAGDELSACVRQWCYANRCVCDGDVFGIAFADKADYTHVEVDRICHQFADAYDLWEPTLNASLLVVVAEVHV